ncbi:MAG: 7-cyano-7-deazaguanine synthase, partial [Cyanobacteriota bacterium]|nr:7-cyano-7-deazaguanine synthase [Cyanobacteriota bacterium]
MSSPIPASGTTQEAPPLAIALLSGGLDSATAAALALEAGYRVIGLSFDYGQRHRRELAAA